ncbi:MULTISPECIES: MFS transporter [Bacillaceae]|uniref:MFS transporter n=1 Tax=Bacillaceae TaxID=186817 RepID=UPI000BFC11E1|nr:MULTISPECIES: MFS transporter [Bacillaceae]PGT79770.1 MFS transporter [Bacillus sp. AFS040349]UGB33367.1 MFS transporter [Metabacillus sp. B2-18]
MKEKLVSWKYPSILLIGIGVSNFGEWIYFISLNLIVFDLTGSPLAVSGLYIIKPLATLLTNFWAGSIIDRLNKRKLMVFLDIFRALFIALLPFMLSIAQIYLVVFIINMASSMFGPTSMTYITKLVPQKQRKQFNSLHSLVTSGAFLIGPAIAGLLFFIGTSIFAIYTNAIALFISGMITLLMPDIEKQTAISLSNNKLSIKMIKRDWYAVVEFSRGSSYIMMIYFLFSCVMVIMASAIDSLEAAFAKEVLFLSDSEYGFLVTIAGAGIVVGALINSLTAKKLKTSILIGLGSVLVSTGYMIYAISSSFIIAALGFFILAFFIACANTGFLTFYQNNIPVDVMGRIGSAYSLIQAILIIIITSIMGVAAQITSIQVVVFLGVLVMLVLSITLCTFSLLPSKKQFYEADAESNRSISL